MSRVLIVEDEPAIARIVSVLLRGYGIETLTTTDAESASAVLERMHPDCVITDVVLPGKNGVELTHEIRSRPDTADVPVILMSAYGEPRSHEANCFIPKPFDIDALISAIEDFLQEAREANGG